MRPKLAFVCALLGVLGVFGTRLPLFGEDAPKYSDQVTNTERLNFAPGGTIRVNGSYGYLNIEAWDQPEVEIIVTKSVPRVGDSKPQDQDQRRLERIHVATDHPSATELTISTTLASRHGDWAPPLPPTTTNCVAMEYEIHVPRDSKLVIHHGTGSVFVSGVIGDIEASAGRGDILLMLPDSGAYSIDAKTKFGAVSSDLEGSVLSQYMVGQRFVRSLSPPSRRLHLRMGFGGITIKTVPPEVEAPAPVDTK